MIDRLFRTLTKVNYRKYREQYAIDNDSDHELSKIGSGSKMMFAGLSSPQKVKPIPDAGIPDGDIQIIDLKP